MKNLQFEFSVDKANNKIYVKREFAATRDKVWAAWTQSELLDKWWAPKPYRSETKSMDFREGGFWLYAMVSPENEKHWARADYQSIDPFKSFSALDAFCDENGNLTQDFPRQFWNNSFTENGATTTVNITISYDKPEDLEKILEMGFKEGFTMGLGNLDELLAAQNA